MPAARRSHVTILLAAVFLAYLAQQTLNPVIAPLSRAVGLAEWQVGLTISCAAIMVVLTSQPWGRRSQSWGRKPVLLLALGLATIALTVFAAVAAAGMAGLLVGAWLFALFLISRGIGFGAAIAAIPPTAQAFIADITHDESARVKGMAGVGAVQGVAMLAGAVLGGVLSIFGLWTPIVVVPILLAASFLLVALRLPREAPESLVEQPSQVRPTDPRVWPFLVAGFGLFTSLGFVQILAGFLIQDRLGLDDATTGAVTGMALLVAGLGMILAQAVLVPKSGWAPVTLLRVGSLVGVGGFILLIPNWGVIVLCVAMGLVGVGLGIAAPGYTAGPTLAISREEQGGLAGLIGATNGLTFVVAPTASTALYGVWPVLPILVSTAVMGCVASFVWFSPGFRRSLHVESAPAPR
ncbi:MAG: MFS transporter [Propioniciclava sp.]